MAFTWEVEALRKMIEATIASTAAEHNILQDAAKEERDIWEEERFGEYPEPDDVTPEDWFGGYRERQERSEEMPPWEGNVFQELAKAARDEEEAELDRDLAPFKRLYQQGKREAGRKVKEEGDKLKLDWVNEILQELPEDKIPEVLRLPQWKDEEKKPDMSPFLSYLLRQSPYARLPAAGLLAAGLMGYSKPAY